MINIFKVKGIIDFNNDDFLLQDKVLVANEKIIKICTLDEALSEFKEAKLIDFSEYILSPVFNNLHSHLEFSLSLLNYGDFAVWLESIMKNKEEINQAKLTEEINKNINILLKSGVGYLGEISSFGANLEPLLKSPIKSIIFHEILGANSSVVNKNIEFFEKRFYKYEGLNNHISLHSPYSICDEIYDYAINFAKKNDLFISTHYAESKYESGYLKGEQNPLANYLSRFNPSGLKRDFIAGFRGLKAIFTHCNYLKDLSVLDEFIITSCARSNRFLGSKKLDIFKVNNLSFGTDGLSSNNSLNFFDELRAILLSYDEININELAKKIYKASVYDSSHLFLDGAKPLSPNSASDFMLLDGFGYSKDQLLAQIILRTKEIKKMYLNGKEII